MNDTAPPTKRPAKKAAARPRRDVPARARAELPEASKADIPIPDEVFVIEPIIKRYRYMFKGGHTLDCTSPYRSDSTDRELVLKEAQRRWGGKKDDWQIVGSTELTIDAEEPPP